MCVPLPSIYNTLKCLSIFMFEQTGSITLKCWFKLSCDWYLRKQPSTTHTRSVLTVYPFCCVCFDGLLRWIAFHLFYHYQTAIEWWFLHRRIKREKLEKLVGLAFCRCRFVVIDGEIHLQTHNLQRPAVNYYNLHLLTHNADHIKSHSVDCNMSLIGE